MDNQDPEQKRFTRATRDLSNCYLLLAAILQQLPIPVRIPTDDGRSTTILPALMRAMDLVADEPADEYLRELLRSFMLDWLAAYDMGFLIDEAGIAEWRLRVMEENVEKMIAIAEVAAGILAGLDEE